MAKKQQPSPDITLFLTEDEAYTLQILLGIVAGDKEVYSVSNKLVEATQEELVCEDYERLEFYFGHTADGKMVQLDATENELVIKIK